MRRVEIDGKQDLVEAAQAETASGETRDVRHISPPAAYGSIDSTTASGRASGVVLRTHVSTAARTSDSRIGRASIFEAAVETQTARNTARMRIGPRPVASLYIAGDLITSSPPLLQADENEDQAPAACQGRHRLAEHRFSRRSGRIQRLHRVPRRIRGGEQVSRFDRAVRRVCPAVDASGERQPGFLPSAIVSSCDITSAGSTRRRRL